MSPIKQFRNTYLLRFFPKGSAIRDLVTLVSGTAIGQLIVVGSSPVLTRIYSPEEFGVMGVYAALLAITGVIAGLRYELAIPLPRINGAAINLLTLALICVVVTTLLLSGVITIFYVDIPRWLNTPAIAPYLWLLPVGFFLTGFYQSFHYWAIRRKNFSVLAQTSIQQGIGAAATQVALGINSFGSTGLIVGQIIGQCAGLSALAIKAYTQNKRQLRRINCQRIIFVAKRYSSFPKYSTWQALANTSSVMLPLILFASLLSPAIVGFYMLSYRSLSLPLTLIGSSIGKVFHSRAAEAYHAGNLDQLTLKVFQQLLRIGLGPLIFVGILAPDLFAFIFGETWRQAGVFAQWMVPWLIIQLVVSPLSIVCSVTGHQQGELVSQILFVTVRIGALLIGALLTEKNLSVELFALSGFFVYTGLFIWILKILKIGFSHLLIGFRKAMYSAIDFIALAVTAKVVWLNNDLFSFQF